MNKKKIKIGSFLVAIIIGIIVNIMTGWVTIAGDWLWSRILEIIIFQRFTAKLVALAIFAISLWWLIKNKLTTKEGVESEDPPEEHDVSLLNILKPIIAIALIAVSGIFLLMGGGPSAINQTKNIGIIYNSDNVDENNFVSEITTRFVELISKHGTSISLDFHNLRGQSNPALSIDEFTKEKNIRYLIFSSAPDNVNIEDVLSRGEKKYISVNTSPFELTDNQKSELISVHISARQEVASFVEFLVSKKARTVLLIHPAISTMSEFEKNFYQSFRAQTAPHFIEVREIADNQLAKLDDAIDLNNNNSIVMLGDQNVYLRLKDQLDSDVDYDLLISNYSINNASLTLFSKENIFTSLPWPKSSNEYLPINKHLVIAAVESIIELDVETTDEDGKKIRVHSLREKMFEQYDLMQLALTQEYFGKTELVETSYPNFVIYNLKTKNIIYD